MLSIHAEQRDRVRAFDIETVGRAIEEMYRVFNMGIGMILVAAARDVDAVRQALLNSGEANSVVIGDIVSGNQDVQYA